ncbi:MAG: hypothetical protein WAK25_13570, partial [Acidobacteriaceae bacterium]
MTTLRFGIPSLDRLIDNIQLDGKDTPDTVAKIHEEPRRVTPPSGTNQDDAEPQTTSMSIIGPDGTGKSVLGLHLASQYLFDHGAETIAPSVFYVSTDLSYSMAQQRTWFPFALNRPGKRMVPFDENSAERTNPNAFSGEITLQQLQPLGAGSASDGEPVARFLSSIHHQGAPPKVGFVDLAANTAGDDWGFVNRMLALLPPVETAHPHLVILDAIEGFETLVGDLDAYGQISTRRSRIAQIMRSAHGRCHLVFIAEEPSDEMRIPEQFVTDVVLRLRKKSVGDYIRRTVEVEKARGLEHVRGMHQYVIRSGKGSSTGDKINLDDPKVPAPANPSERRPSTLEPEDFPRDGEQNKAAQSPLLRQSYVHVFSSLHYSARALMHTPKEKSPAAPRKRFAAFGIRYLDNMLDGEVAKDVSYIDGFDSSGLPCATVTALIGDALTQKTRLGRAFLNRCFSRYPLRLVGLAKVCAAGRPAIEQYLTEKCNVADLSHVPSFSLPDNSSYADRLKLAADILAETKANASDGVAVLITTHDVDGAMLSSDFSNRLLRDSAVSAAFGISEQDQKAVKERLFAYCDSRTICRRLEIHDLSSSILMHIVQCAVRGAQSIAMDRDVPLEREERFGRSHHIRVVIDDFSALLATYPEVRNDPLFLPALLFHLRREGVTSLIVDTHSGQPDAPHVHAIDSELRALVDQRLYTWHVPFYGENRVAIAPIPPLSNATVRELRTSVSAEEDESDKVLEVDPEFEMYSGLEERRPQPVPLEINVHEETPVFRDYIERENQFYRSVFAPNTNRAGTTRDIIVSRQHYEGLQDLCYLDNNVRLDHTLVFELDEFWASGPTNALANLSPYLHEITTGSQAGSGAGDPFGLFQPTLLREGGPVSAFARYKSFPQYFRDKSPSEEHVDRVPFCWDFGFLVCRQRPWELAASTDPQVKTVWDTLRKVSDPKVRDDPKVPDPKVSTETRSEPPERTRDDKAAQFTSPIEWKDFFNACRSVARAESAKHGAVVAPFDLSLLSPESFACLVLEIWWSEIAKSAFPLGPESRRWEKKRSENDQLAKGLIEWLEEDDFDHKYRQWKDGDDVTFSGHWLALYKAWLMLGECLELSSLAQPSSSFEFCRRPSNLSAVATRQWYKTASAMPNLYSDADPTVLAQLPGRYSVRGDWFLAASRNSRSIRLAHRAIDILSSRRGNISRLTMGIGLPVRDIMPIEIDRPLSEIQPNNVFDGPRTCLFKPGRQGERHTVSYADLLYLSADSHNSPLHWLWRSSLKDYDRHSRVFCQWLCRMMVLMHQLKLSLHREWVDNFAVLDLLSKAETDPTKRRDF